MQFRNKKALIVNLQMVLFINNLKARQLVELKVDNDKMTSMEKTKPISKLRLQSSHSNSLKKKNTIQNKGSSPISTEQTEYEDRLGSIDSILQPEIEDYRIDQNEREWRQSLQIDEEFRFQDASKQEQEDPDIKQFLQAQIPGLYSQSNSIQNDLSLSKQNQKSQNINQKSRLLSFGGQLDQQFNRNHDIAIELKEVSDQQYDEQLEEDDYVPYERNNFQMSGINEMPPYLMMSKYQKQNYFDNLNSIYMARLEAIGGKQAPLNQPTKQGKGKRVSLFCSKVENFSEESSKEDDDINIYSRKITFDQVVSHIPFNKQNQPIQVRQTRQQFTYLDPTLINFDQESQYQQGEVDDFEQSFSKKLDHNKGPIIGKQLQNQHQNQNLEDQAIFSSDRSKALLYKKTAEEESQAQIYCQE